MSNTHKCIRCSNPIDLDNTDWCDVCDMSIFDDRMVDSKITNKIDMKTFNDLEFRQSYAGGEISRLFFDNGYGVSVVRGPFTYGGPEGLFELAILDAQTQELVFNTPITDDVIGHLTEEGVTQLMTEIQLL